MKNNNNKGIAVILMLSVMLILWGVGFSFVKFVQLRQQKSAILQGQWPLRLAVENGMVDAIGQIQEKIKSSNGLIKDFKTWSTFSGEMNDVTYEVKIEDQSAKFNLNASTQVRDQNDRAIGLLFQNLGFSSMLDFPLINQYRDDHSWVSSLQELMFFLPEVNRRDIFKQINPFLNIHSYDWNQSFDGQPLLNVWQLAETPSWDFEWIERIKHIYQEEGPEIIQALLNILDYMDADLVPTVMSFQSASGVQEIYGREPSPLINELRMRTSKINGPLTDYSFPHSNGGEYIELFNPYDIPISLDGYRLQWNSRHHGQEQLDLSSYTVEPSGFLIITDNTRRLFNIDSVKPTSQMVQVVELDKFELDEIDFEEVTLFSQGVLRDRMSMTGASLDKSIEKSDPRHGGVANLSEGYSPGALNSGFSNYLAGLSSGQPQDLFLHSGVSGYDFRLGLSAFSLLYADKDPWQTIALDVGNYVKGVDEGAFALLKWVQWIHEVEDVDVYDEKDSISDEFKLRSSGRININTASARVLQALFNVSLAVAEDIEAQSFDYVYEVAQWVPQESFWQALPLLTTRSHLFWVTVKAELQGRAFTLQCEIDCGDDLVRVVWRKVLES